MGAEESFIPVYYHLEKSLRDQILTGALKPGEAIPLEAQLARQFSTSCMSVRQALSRLVFKSPRDSSRVTAGEGVSSRSPVWNTRRCG